MAVRVGLVGFGLAGRYFHAPLIAEAGFDIAAVVTSRRDEVAADLPEAAVLSDLEALLALDDIDLVVLATPHALHFRQADAALRAGRHVVVDKPLAVTPAEADALVALARETGQVLAAFHNRRWDADFLTMRRLIGEGVLGDLASLHIRWDRFRPQVQERWREHDQPGAGLLHDLGPHLIDQAVQLMGPPDWLQSDICVQRPGGVVNDQFEILMARGPVRITIGASSIAADGGWRYRLHGNRGTYLKAGLDVQETQLRSGVGPGSEEFGVEPQSQWGVLVDGETRRPVASERGRWTDFYLGMRAAIVEAAPPPVDPAEAAGVIGLIAAAEESAATGRRIILAREQAR